VSQDLEQVWTQENFATREREKHAAGVAQLIDRIADLGRRELASFVRPAVIVFEVAVHTSQVTAVRDLDHRSQRTKRALRRAHQPLQPTAAERVHEPPARGTDKQPGPIGSSGSFAHAAYTPASSITSTHSTAGAT
jgi:hypothetical protein